MSSHFISHTRIWLNELWSCFRWSRNTGKTSKLVDFGYINQKAKCSNSRQDKYSYKFRTWFWLRVYKMEIYSTKLFKNVLFWKYQILKSVQIWPRAKNTIQWSSWIIIIWVDTIMCIQCLLCIRPCTVVLYMYECPRTIGNIK